MSSHLPKFDLLVVGAGINGAGIARDAAGRGLKVLIVERGDIACATSQWSTKLIHGGLRYLEQYEFRLVHESLAEREVVLRQAPHLVEPLSFVLPHEPHLRPAWMLRAGLFLYDHLGRRETLPRSFGVNLSKTPWGAGLKPTFGKGFVYSDARVDDARLVVCNVMDAALHEADVRVHTALVSARREQDGAGPFWRATLRDDAGATSEATAQSAALKIVDFHNHYIGPSWTLTNVATAPAAARAAQEKINANMQSEGALLASIEQAGVAARVINSPTAFIEDADGNPPPDAPRRIAPARSRSRRPRQGSSATRSGTCTSTKSKS